MIMCSPFPGRIDQADGLKQNLGFTNLSRDRNMRNTGILTVIGALAILGHAESTLAQGLSFAVEKADCQGDAMRLCGPYIPDQGKIRACLVAYKDYLSPACRSIVAPKKR
jgi:hypothetical protein